MKKKLHYMLVCLLFFSIQAFSQVIKGTVINSSDGAPLPGVSVSLKGTKIGSITDGAGNYALSIPANNLANGVLVASFIGYKPKEIAIKNQAIIDIIIEESNEQLNEVVVTALGIPREQKSLGYATTQIKSSELVKVANTNLGSALYGKAPGVRIATGPY